MVKPANWISVCITILDYIYIMYCILLYIVYHLNKPRIFISKIQIKENLRDDFKKADWLVFVLILGSIQTFTMLGWK